MDRRTFPGMAAASTLAHSMPAYAKEPVQAFSRDILRRYGMDIAVRSRFLKTALVCAAALLAPLTAFAQETTASFPQKSVTIVSTFSPGSGPDSMMRIVGDILSKIWKQPVIIDNRPGGAGFIAINAVKAAAPDGYTLMLHDGEALSAMPHLYKSRNVRTLETFEPIGVLYGTPFLVTVPANSKWKSMGELLADAKARPGGISYGTWGVGSSIHLQSSLLESKTGVSMLHVPYKEMSQLYNAVGAGDISWAFGGIASTQFVYKSGKVRYLAVAAQKRIPQMPDVPTLAESGGPANLDVSSFAGLFAPKGTPAAVQEKINADLLKALSDPEVKKRYATFSFETLAWTPAEMKRAMEAKSAIYEQVVRTSKITLE